MANAELPEELDFLSERYGRLTVIGKGASGLVLSAVDKSLGKAVAIKVLSDPESRDERIIRFQREARVVSRLTHPFIVRILDFGAGPDGQLYMVMDLLAGRNLLEVVGGAGPLEPSVALSTIGQVAEALAYAHDHGVVHRDIKPSNIMLVEREDGIQEPLLVDFGLARSEDSGGELTRAGRPLGTPYYVSPEQISGRAADSRSDIYSLGCVLVFALTGKPPFRGASVLETYDLHLHEPFAGLSSIPGYSPEDSPECPAALFDRLDRLVARALAKNPDERFQSMSEFKAALDETLDLIAAEPPVELPDLSVLSAPIARGEASWRWPLMISLAVLSAGLLAWAVIVRPWQISPEAPRIGEPPHQRSSRRVEQMKDTFKKSKIAELSENYWISGFSDMNDEDLAALKDKEVVSLRLPSTLVSGAGLRYIDPDRLTELDLSQTRVSDQNLEHVAAMRSLRRLWLGQNTITDRGLEKLAVLHRLSSLDISYCRGISNKSLAVVASSFPFLYWLDIGHTSVDSSGLSVLESLKNLRILGLGALDLDSSSLLPVSRLSLESLDLCDNKRMDDSGLLRLSRIKTLKRLKVNGCDRITPAGIKALEKRLPGLKVSTRRLLLNDPLYERMLDVME
ncbi:MAG: protein kinase [Candidatus Melainabacteria bacterium]|nr:protein kinase [Candidatus Melainabacteria bacterium]